MRLRRVAFGAFVVAVLCLSAPASAQSIPSSSSAPAGYAPDAPDAPRTRPAPAVFLWIPLILLAGSVYAVRVFIRPISRRDR